MEIDKWCPQPLVFDDSIFGEYLGTLVHNKDGAWEPAVKTDVSQPRCRVLFPRVPGGICAVTMMCGLREQATMTRAQNRLVDEQPDNIHNQSSYNDFGCFFAESKTLELRPA